MLLNKALLLIILTFFSFTAFTQKGTVISGYVKDSSGAIANASVIIKGISKGTVSNDNGYFEITAVKPGSYSLEISYLGYLSEIRKVVLRENQKLSLDFLLKKDCSQLGEVNVTGKTKTREIKETAFSVNVVETKHFANTTADLNQVLNLTTGVRIREQGGMGSNFNFSINGLSGKAVKYFIDGVPMEVMGSTMTLNNIPVNLAERVEVYKGVVPVQLGSDAMGGAVNVITNQKQNNYLDLSYSYGSFNSHRAALSGQYIHKPTGIIVKANAFYNYSDNNYKMKDVQVLEGGTRNGNEITDLNGASFVIKDTRRFHDNYKAVMGQVEAGIINKKWADVLFVGFGASQRYQDLQTGFEQSIVYGNVNRESNSLIGSVRYKKDNLFIKGLSLNLFASKSDDKFTTADTLLRQYYWDGTWTAKGASEMSSIKSVTPIARPRTFARANLSYVLNDNHSFNINYTVDDLKNETYNELIAAKDYTPEWMKKTIVGMAYQQEFFDRRLTNMFFGKYYRLGLTTEKFRNGQTVLTDSVFNNYGYGIATRYKILPDLGIKASFERAYRLQEPEEMFGDGLNVQPNTSLLPESSNNINLGAYYGFNIHKHRFFIEASGFYRKAQDFIYLVADQRSRILQNQNKSGVRITGFEAEVRYDYATWLSFNVNATYQNAINTTKFGSTQSNVPEATYMNKIPNQPWFFGNASMSLGRNEVFRKEDRLQFNWYTQYIHWFFLTWESYGSVNGKSNIPTQVVHNASLTYSLENGKYNISVESRNLTDNLSFDNFRLQKPGRAFSVKLRYFLK